MTTGPARFYLLDSSIYIFQAHFSTYVECYDRDGEELSALYGFCQFILQFLRRIRPEHLALAHDESLFTGFRHELSADYKSNRELPDDNLARQLAGCSELGGVLGLRSFASKKYEADDIIGTLARRVRQADARWEIHIVSKDKDLAQLLLGEGDCLWDYNANRRRYRPDIIEQFGITPEQFPDYLALVGDTVDCIGGVPGIGPVKAKELLRKFGSVENLYSNLDDVGKLQLRGVGRLQGLLQDHRDAAYLSRSLARIVCDVDEPDEPFSQARLDEMTVGTPNVASFELYLERYGFPDRERGRLLSLCRSLASQA